MTSPRPTKIMTLCLVYKHPKILLGMKKRGFGEGRWNGYGGKIKPGETLEENIVREMQEECGILPTRFRQRAVMYFEFENGSDVFEVNLFEILEYKGKPVETEEMKPSWFHVDDLPWSQMWPDDEYWYPLFLAGKNFEGYFLFKDQNTIIRHELKESI